MPAERIDTVAVDRRAAGERHIRLNQPERLELVRRLHAHGLSDGEIARRAGYHQDQVFRDRQSLRLPLNPTPNVSGRYLTDGDES